MRPLVISDANERYSKWLSNPIASKFISVKPNIKELKSYVKSKITKNNILFLGIHTAKEKLHIGNIKYEPVNIEKKYALMGVLIGDQDWWGKGVACEVVTASAKYLKDKYKIEEIILGVKENNIAAIKAYKKIGFNFEKSKYLHEESESVLTMILKIKFLES